jgi:hypothetical protein
MSWIPHDECEHSPCDQPPITYDFDEETPEHGTLVGSCLGFGDPHFVGFEMAKGEHWKKLPHFDHYGTGSFWIVHSNAVWIQGYYAAANTRRPAYTNLRKVAIGGPFLGKNTLMVEGSNIWWNEQPHILDFSVPQKQSWSGHVGAGAVTATSISTPSKTTVELAFPADLNISISIYQYPHVPYLLPKFNMLINMRQIIGQDGHCGSFNGDSSDDTHYLIKTRWNQQLPVARHLFHIR